MKNLQIAWALAAALVLSTAVQAQQKSQEETFAGRYKGSKYHKDYINPNASEVVIPEYKTDASSRNWASITP